VADACKILGLGSPITPGQVLDGYVCPSAKYAVVSSILVCNRNVTTATFRIAVVKGGIATAPDHYIYYDLPILGNDTFVATIGITLATGDVVRWSTGAAGLNFHLYGVESDV
jgi:hypothetical protein